MFGELSSEPAWFTFIASRDLVNADISYRPADCHSTVGIYGRDITGEPYEHAQHNTGGCVMVMLSVSERGWAAERSQSQHVVYGAFELSEKTFHPNSCTHLLSA